MQTISVRWTADAAVRDKVAGWLRVGACMVRTGYAMDGEPSAAEIETHIKARFPDSPLGSWAAHCAAYESKSLRSLVPDGSMVFGSKLQLLRRQKGLISHEEWQQRRHARALTIIGDRTRWGNRHFRLSADARQCIVTFLKDEITLDLVDMAGKSGKLLKAVALLAEACQISVQFSLSPTHLSVTFDPMDLRRLPSGTTLEDVKIAEQGASRKGRKRKDASTHYAAQRVKHIADRPVHPEWRDANPVVKTRALGIDLNPQWIGFTVIEISADPQSVDSVRVLDHQLHHIRIPFAADAANMTQAMACAVRSAVSLARAWNCSLIVHEHGLGKLAWSKKSRGSQTVNYWSRNAFIGGLQRRCNLAGIKLLPIWGGYSSTIGNLCFDLPDACAAAAEIARRGFASTTGTKDRLPAVPPQLTRRRWKDGDVRVDLDQAASWQDVHRAIKSAQAGRKSGIGYRRLHPSPQAMVPGRFEHQDRSYAVNRLGSGKGTSCSARPVLQTRTVRDSSDRALSG
jgi:hypothetical protein